MKNELDIYDKKILNFLQEDGSISNLELSKKIGLGIKKLFISGGKKDE